MIKNCQKYDELTCIHYTFVILQDVTQKVISTKT